MRWQAIKQSQSEQRVYVRPLAKSLHTAILMTRHTCGLSFIKWSESPRKGDSLGRGQAGWHRSVCGTVGCVAVGIDYWRYDDRSHTRLTLLITDMFKRSEERWLWQSSRVHDETTDEGWIHALWWDLICLAQHSYHPRMMITLRSQERLTLDRATTVSSH